MKFLKFLKMFYVTYVTISINKILQYEPKTEIDFKKS